MEICLGHEETLYWQDLKSHVWLQTAGTHMLPPQAGYRISLFRFRKQQSKTDTHTQATPPCRTAQYGLETAYTWQNEQQSSFISSIKLWESKCVDIYKNKRWSWLPSGWGVMERHQSIVWNLILIRTLKRKERNTPELTRHKTRPLKREKSEISKG